MELQPLCAKIVRIAPSAPPVDVPVLVHEQVVRIAPPVSLPDYAATRGPDPPPAPTGEVSGPRCGAPKPNGRTCISTMYRDQGGGRRRCRGCGTVAVPAMKGAEV